MLIQPTIPQMKIIFHMPLLHEEQLNSLNIPPPSIFRPNLVQQHLNQLQALYFLISSKKISFPYLFIDSRAVITAKIADIPSLIPGSACLFERMKLKKLFNCNS